MPALQAQGLCVYFLMDMGHGVQVIVNKGCPMHITEAGRIYESDRCM